MCNDKEKGKTILIVEDEPDVAEFLSTLLRDNGYRVIIATDGREGIELIRANKPDLVSLDISLPETSGIKLYRAVKENPELKSIPVIIVTGAPKKFEVFISTRRQVPPPDGYISKPIDKKKFLERVEKLLQTV